MNQLVLLAIWISVRYIHHVAAEKDLKKIDLVHYKHSALLLNLPNKLRGTACPASTEREIKFNDEVSVSGNSLFLRDVYNKNEMVILSICDKPVEPVMLYNLEYREYDIGYEVYYEQGKIQLELSEYFRYRPVGINNEIINTTKSPSQYVVDHHEGNSTTFHFTDGSPALIFHWISKLSFTYSAHTKQTKVSAKNIPPEGCAPVKCPNHGLSEQDMSVYVSSNDDENHFELWKDHHSYGALEISQIMPARFFSEPSAILASCSQMNTVPIWKSILEGQLKKVDLYLQRVINAINWSRSHGDQPVWCIDNVSFGSIGVLEEPINKQKMYYSDIEHRRQIAIPKVIYRMLEGNENRGPCNAIIVVHNDPTHVSDSDRICTKEDEVPGWEKITNGDPKTGLTYVCHYRLKKISPSGIFNLDSEDVFSVPLRLDKVPHAGPYDYCESIDFEDEDMRNYI